MPANLEHFTRTNDNGMPPNPEIVRVPPGSHHHLDRLSLYIDLARGTVIIEAVRKAYEASRA